MDTSHAELDRPAKRQRLETGDATTSSLPSGEKQSLKAETEKRREERAGITAYVNAANNGFRGILKTRYTDFLVNEISPSGQVLHLRSLDLPAKLQQEKSTNGTETPANPKPETHNPDGSRQVAKQEAVTQPANGEGQVAEIPDDDVAALKVILGDKTTTAALKLDRQVQTNPQKKARDFRHFHSEPIDDKQARTDAHQLVRRVFSSRLETTTEEDNTIKFQGNPQRIRGTQWTRNNAGGRANGRLGWDELGGEYLHFTLYKENKDTMEAVGYMCSQMKVQPRSFQYPGTKDRRAVTVQRMAAYRLHAQRLAGLNKLLRGARLGDFKYERVGLELGELGGNAFTITLRDCHFDEEDTLSLDQRLDLATRVVEQATAGLQQYGFINYYGLQRFGSFDSSTDHIGKLLLQGNYEGAVNSILGFSTEALAAYNGEETAILISADERNRAAAINAWNTKSSASEASALMPRKYNAESNIIRHLGFVDKRTGALHRTKDFQGALHSITRNLRLMYVHAYQSLVWNTVASKRWELYGSQVVEGDLVIIDTKARDAADQGLDYDDQGEVIVRPAEHDAAADAESAFERARPLSKDEAESGKYTIFDVVLPQPGFDVEYPRNASGQFYSDFMGSEQGGGLNPHAMRRSWRDISLPGGYRKFMARPTEVSYEVRPYLRDTEQMVETDYERLLKEGKVREDLKMTRPEQAVNAAEASEEDGEKKVAVIVRMQLESSQYATCALREMSRGGVAPYQPDYGTAG